MARLKPHLARDRFDLGEVLWDAGSRSPRLYFPESGLISMIVPLAGDEKIEVGSVSCEGTAGINSAFGYSSGCTRGIVTICGTFRHIAVERFLEAARQSAELSAFASISRDWILRQAQHLAACNALHDADERFCRWLALASDRMGVNVLPVTQEIIATALGLRRTTVTAIAKQVENAGLISYSRAKITVQDIDKLRDSACVCHKLLDSKHWPQKRLLTEACHGKQRA